MKKEPIQNAIRKIKDFIKDSFFVAFDKQYWKKHWHTDNSAGGKIGSLIGAFVETAIRAPIGFVLGVAALVVGLAVGLAVGLIVGGLKAVQATFEGVKKGLTIVKDEAIKRPKTAGVAFGAAIAALQFVPVIGQLVTGTVITGAMLTFIAIGGGLALGVIGEKIIQKMHKNQVAEQNHNADNQNQVANQQEHQSNLELKQTHSTAAEQNPVQPTIAVPNNSHVPINNTESRGERSP